MKHFVPHDMHPRRGDWMQTFSGIQFWPLDPRLDEICIEDIAHSLAYQCRYNGHCGTFYSVAEHSVILAGYAKPEHKLAALLHDAAEAYICDVPRPVKKYLQGFREIEERLERLIAMKFGAPYPWPLEVHVLDESILADERDQLMATPPADWKLRYPPLNAHLPCWEPDTAKLVFLNCFRMITTGQTPIPVFESAHSGQVQPMVGLKSRQQEEAPANS
jgi:hypothetical protein